MSINDHFKELRKPDDCFDIFGKIIVLKVQRFT